MHKGQVLAHMYLEPNGNSPGPHIHFSVQPEGEKQQAPAIFSDEIVQAFHEKWGQFRFDLKSGDPDEGDTGMPACMGYKLTADENPFAANDSACLK